MRPSPKRHLPSMVTALNLFAGFLSVIHSIRGDFLTAAWLIVVAAIMDVLDGKVARLVKSSSEFGVELDSLADISSFGFAPAILIYQSFLHTDGFVGIVISFLPLVFGGIRLARFNIEVTDFHEKDDFFKGLPIPSSAISLAAFVVFEQATFGGFYHREVLIALAIIVSLLMVSRVRYDSMPRLSMRRPSDIVKMALLAIFIPLFVLYPSKIIFPTMMVFLLTGLLRTAVAHFKQHDDEDEEVPDIPVVE